MSDKILKELCSSLKLERDRGFQQLVSHLQSLDEEGIYNLQLDLSKLLNDAESAWESKHGALMGAKAILENGNVSDDFEVELRRKVMELLDDNEFRVRIAAGKALSYLFHENLPWFYAQTYEGGTELFSCNIFNRFLYVRKNLRLYYGMMLSALLSEHRLVSEW